MSKRVKRVDAYGSDRPEYAEWMSKRSYYRRMVKKWGAKCSGGGDPTNDVAEAKLAMYESKVEDADRRIIEARAKYGIKSKKTPAKEEDVLATIAGAQKSTIEEDQKLCDALELIVVEETSSDADDIDIM